MNLTRATAPAEEPVTSAEAKAHLRVTHTDDDTAIAAMIVAAREHLDGNDGTLGRALVTQTWDLSLDSFPSEIVLPLPPLQSVTSVTYVDTNGDTQTLATSGYEVDVAGGRIRATDAGWPDTDDCYNAVTVRFVCGYGLADDVPQAIKHAMLLMIGGMYAFRESLSEGAVVETPTVKALLRPYRRSRF